MLEEAGGDFNPDDGAVRLLDNFLSPSLPASSRFPELSKVMVKRSRLRGIVPGRFAVTL